MEKMPEPYTILISNPPYGQRVGDRKILQAVNGHFRELLAADESLSCYVITADRTLEKAIGRKADRRRKLYNGNLETCYYQYYGRRPPKKENEGNVSSVR